MITRLLIVFGLLVGGGALIDHCTVTSAHRVEEWKSQTFRYGRATEDAVRLLNSLSLQQALEAKVSCSYERHVGQLCYVFWHESR